jgi:hypothetical protein
MQTHITSTELFVVLLVLFVGVLWYVGIARRDAALLTRNGGPRERLRLGNFFLAGGTLGSNLTENNTLGMTFAWAGGTWFFATTAYAFGPQVLWFQVPWCISVIALGILTPRIITRIQSRTIHGFLERHYGKKTRAVAAVATTIGYVVNAGFEIFWPSMLFSMVLGKESLSLPVALGLAAVIGSYCAIGGYRSNASVDQPHNILGVLSLAIVVVAVSVSLKIGGPFWNAVLVFAGGSLIYCLTSAARALGVRFSQTVLNALAFAFAFATLLIFIFFLTAPEGASVDARLLANAPIPAFLLWGVITFQLFFNLVDMQGWQQIAANENVEPREPVRWRAIGWSIVRASLYLLWFPALGGTLLGCAMRLVSGVNQFTLFPLAFGLVLPESGELLRGLVLGGLLFSFLSTSMSTVDSLLMSAMQTLSYDLLGHRKVEQALSAPDRNADAVIDAEFKISSMARSLLIPMAIFMTMVFYAMSLVFPDNVLLFQPLMYSLPLPLLAPVLVALFFPASVTGAVRRASFIGITAALGLSAVMLYGTFVPQSAIELARYFFPRVVEADLTNWLPSLLPVVANGISILAIAVGLLIGRFGHKAEA